VAEKGHIGNENGIAKQQDGAIRCETRKNGKITALREEGERNRDRKGVFKGGS